MCRLLLKDFFFIFFPFFFQQSYKNNVYVLLYLSPQAQNHQSYLQLFCLLSNAIKLSLYAVQKQLKPHQRHTVASGSGLFTSMGISLGVSQPCMHPTVLQPESSTKAQNLYFIPERLERSLYALFTDVHPSLAANKTADVKKPPTYHHVMRTKSSLFSLKL